MGALCATQCQVLRYSSEGDDMVSAHEALGVVEILGKRGQVAQHRDEEGRERRNDNV